MIDYDNWKYRYNVIASMKTDDNDNDDYISV